MLTHLVRYDLRRSRWLALAWVIITVGAFAIHGFAPFLQTGRRESEAVAMTVSFAWLAQLLVAAILLPLVVHTHAAVGTTGFWMTRPFPVSALVTSKLLLLFALFVGLPALCEAVTMAFYRVPFVTLLLAVLEAALQRAAILCTVLAIAVLTRNLARFALAMGAIVVGVAMILNVWVMLFLLREGDHSVEFVLTTGLPVVSYPEADATREIVAALATVVVGIAVVLVQYKTRATRRTVAFALIGAIFIGVLGLAWPWPLLQATTTVPEWAQDPLTARLVSVEPIAHVEQSGPRVSPSFFRVARSRVYLQDVPAGWLAETRLVSALVSADGGERVEAQGVGYTTVLDAGPSEGTSLNVTLKTLLGVDLVAGANLSSGESLALLTARAHAPMDREFVGNYRGDFAVVLAEVSLIGIMPLDRPSTFQLGAFRMTLLDRRWFEEGVHLRLRLSDVPSISLDRTARADYRFYLRNTARRQAVEGQQLFGTFWNVGPRLPGMEGLYLAPASPFYADARELTFSSNYYGKQFAVHVDQSWVQDAELVILRVRPAGSITRTLEIPRMRFVPMVRR